MNPIDEDPSPAHGPVLSVGYALMAIGILAIAYAASDYVAAIQGFCTLIGLPML